MDIAIMVLAGAGIVALLIGWCWFCWHHPVLGLILSLLNLGD